MRNPLWLDVLILLPLAAYGVYVLVRELQWAPLAITVAIAVITCWYTAYMLIIFLCLLVALELVAYSADCKRLSLKAVMQRIVRFVLAGVVSLLLASFTFMPTVSAMLGGSEGIMFTEVLSVTAERLVSGFFLGNWTVDSVPQSFAGTVLLCTTALFFLLRCIPARVKIAALIVFAFMVASVSLAPLLYVWSGFRMPTGFYCRIAFFIAFVELWMAGSACSKASDPAVSFKPIVASGAIISVIAIIVCALGLFARVRYCIATVGICVAFIVVFLIYLRCFNASRVRAAISLVLCVCVFAELLYGAHINWLQLYKGYEQQRYDAYLSDSQIQFNELREYDDGLYRVDKTYTRVGRAALNEGAVLDYLALSTYASSQDIAAVNMLNELGYSREGEFLSRYADSILATDSLFGVKYVSSGTCPVGFTDVGLMTVESEPDVDGARFFENPYALALGYEVDGDAVGFVLPEGQNPFEKQNALVSALLGEEVDLYVPLEATSTFLSEGYLQYTVEVPAGMIGYAYTVVPSGGSVWVTIDENEPVKDNWRFRHAITAIGEQSEEDAVYQVALSTGSSLDGSVAALCEGASCVLYGLDMRVFSSMIETLKERELSISSFEAGHIEASYDADEDGYALVSIPATKGWSACVNGQQVDCSSACEGGLMIVPLSAGENVIVMDFTPPGLTVGCAVSAVSVAALIVFLVGRSLRARRGRSGAAARHASEPLNS